MEEVLKTMLEFAEKRAKQAQLEYELLKEKVESLLGHLQK